MTSSAAANISFNVSYHANKQSKSTYLEFVSFWPIGISWQPGHWQVRLEHDACVAGTSVFAWVAVVFQRSVNVVSCMGEAAVAADGCSKCLPLAIVAIDFSSNISF